MQTAENTEFHTESLEELHSIVESRKGKETVINGYLSVDARDQVWLLDERDSDENNKNWRLSKFIIPRPLMSCSICNVKWTAHDLRNHMYRETDGHAHKHCLQKSEGKRELGSFLVAFLEAGLIAFRVDKLENKYWPDAYKNEYYYTDWYVVHTNKADFEVGWRKRVIELTLRNRPDINLGELFPDYGFTKDKDYIHAYSTQSLTKFLKGIATKLDEGYH